MTEATDNPLPEQLDGEPDFGAEITRLHADLAALKEESEALRQSTDYADLIARLDSLVPEDQRTNAPSDASDIDKVFHKITTALAASKRPVVPLTDTARPSLETPAEDLSSLPPHVRIARGYAA